MQVILLLLLLNFTHAETPECSPAELENQCFNLLCKTTPKKKIPLESEEIEAAVNLHSYELPQKIQEEFSIIHKAVSSIKNEIQKVLEEGRENKLAEDVLKSPVEAMRQLKALFESDLSCLPGKEKCELIVNDLSPVPQGMQELYKFLHEKTYVLLEHSTLSLEEKKKHYTAALENLIPRRSEAYVSAEKKKVGKIKNEGDFITYMRGADWTGDYLDIISSESVKYKNDLSVALKGKLQEAGEGGPTLAKLQDSCRSASFVIETVNQNSSDEKFTELKKKVLENFRTKFLPKLSKSSRKELLSSLDSDPFYMIDMTGSYHPAFPNLGAHYDNYKKPLTSEEFLKDLNLLNRTKSYVCNIPHGIVSDSFNIGTGQIFVSKFSVANGYGDPITHELGHWLSLQMQDKKMSSSSRRKLLQVRKCIADNYAEKSKSTLYLKHSGDKFRTEEDFADWFTAKAGVGESGLFCDLKKLKSNLMNAHTGQLYLPHEGDVHSNYLFRELNVRLNRDEVIPQSCKDLMDTYPDMAPNKCDL